MNSTSVTFYIHPTFTIAEQGLGVEPEVGRHLIHRAPAVSDATAMAIAVAATAAPITRATILTS